jgi:hypothetical protein
MLEFSKPIIQESGLMRGNITVTQKNKIIAKHYDLSSYQKEKGIVICRDKNKD